MTNIQEALARHQRIALQVSGGRDSLACWYLMKPYLDRVMVYWCNPGDPFPETLEQMEQVKAESPHFVEVMGNVHANIQQHGLPSDLVPASHTPIGAAATGGGLLIQDRYSCCLRSLMLPLHHRMKQDGITLVVRGQKDADELKAPIKSGQVDDGIEYLFPVEDWTHAQVTEFLKDQGATLPRFYLTLNKAPDCMGCTAYWEDGVAGYLKQHHPEQYQRQQDGLEQIRQATFAAIANFNREVSA